ncbi:MAG: two-component system response regulator [Nitrospirae bacterium RIFOXYB2_FULL_43_5]|nr:MAG: two-component system response regulator [Nitrospirae bacterium GWF2_44_13]OGW32292.1 MAG: two-component system response regulator [Nitrospirae bacterium GWD2_44_7]OGW66287.1 MAG: two-component system response regulator [Nitrospirae bacterium RIFOXYA2_FULL_44_9]OGW78193.1 MAG: two-component system response regulator [Nitrospirae bacterium RIFOXYB2_FULL_43_5]HBG93531.1 response regulator [Nitrospiraceae bacterium]
MPNILVVEDSPTMRQLIGFAMKRIAGSKVIEATDGVDALKKLSSEKVDIILADINMPVMDGLKLVSLVRGSPIYKDIPVIMITTEGAEEDRKRALAIGANAYLPKPIQTQELIKLVNGFIGK